MMHGYLNVKYWTLWSGYGLDSLGFEFCNEITLLASKLYLWGLANYSDGCCKHMIQ